MIFLPTKYKRNDGQDVLAVRLLSYKNDKRALFEEWKKKLCVRKRLKSGHFCTLNLPSDFPQMQFSFCTIMNMCISKFAKLHVVARHMFCKLMSNLVWYFSILYVSVNEIWALQQRGRLLTNEFQSFHVMASEELKHYTQFVIFVANFLTSCHFHCLKKNSEH